MKTKVVIGQVVEGKVKTWSLADSASKDVVRGKKPSFPKRAEEYITGESVEVNFK